MSNILRAKCSKFSAIVLFTALAVQCVPATAAAQTWSWWNLGWTSRTTYRPLLGGYRTAYYPQYAPVSVVPTPVSYGGCSTCQPACSTCYRPTYSYAPQVAYRPVTYYRPLATPMVSYYQPSCSSCGTQQVVGYGCNSCGGSSCGSGCNSCGTSSYAMGGSSCSGCSAAAPYSGGALAPVPSNSSQDYSAPANSSQTPQPSLAPSNAPRSIYAPSEGSGSRTFEKPIYDEPTPADPAPAPMPMGSAGDNTAAPGVLVPVPGNPSTSTPRLRPLPTPSSARGLFSNPAPVVEDKTAANGRAVSRVTPASHTVAEPQRLSQEEIDAAGWRSAR